MHGSTTRGLAWLQLVAFAIQLVVLPLVHASHHDHSHEYDTCGECRSDHATLRCGGCDDTEHHHHEVHDRLHQCTKCPVAGAVAIFDETSRIVGSDLRCARVSTGTDSTRDARRDRCNPLRAPPA